MKNQSVDHRDRERFGSEENGLQAPLYSQAVGEIDSTDRFAERETFARGHNLDRRSAEDRVIIDLHETHCQGFFIDRNFAVRETRRELSTLRYAARYNLFACNLKHD